MRDRDIGPAASKKNIQDHTGTLSEKRKLIAIKGDGSIQRVVFCPVPELKIDVTKCHSTSPGETAKMHETISAGAQ